MASGAVRRAYNSVRWRKTRRRLLKRYRYCVMCEEKGVKTEATVADHVLPHRGDIRLFWSGELQALCNRCHNSDKKILENKDRLMPRTTNVGCDQEGNPLQQQEHWS